MNEENANAGTGSKAGPNLYFASVPVYRLGQEAYERETERLIQKHMERFDPEGRYREDPASREHLKDSALRWHGTAWRFNEVIGFVRLRFIRGRDVGGDLWWNTPRPDRRTSQIRGGKRVFRLIDYKAATPVGIEREDSSPEIFSRLLEYLDRVRRQPELRRRYLDSSELESMGACVDWRAILDSHWPIEASGDLRRDVLRRLGYQL
jgi:hypothetical protein